MNEEEFEIEWPPGYFDRREAETSDKGWLKIVVRLRTWDLRYEIHLFDLARARQALQDAHDGGLVSFAEAGLILVDEVNTETVRRAVVENYRAGLFERLKPSFQYL